MENTRHNLEFTSFHIFCGIGGGALGFQDAKEEWKGGIAKVRTLAGIDVDPEACEDFEKLTGSPAHQMDLFSKEQYVDFHGHLPPAEWEEVTPHDIWVTTGGIAPDIVFTSPPCKGFSGLLPEKSANTRKYQALNQLTVRSVKLTLEAFQDDLPALFLLENVPRITTRGKGLLVQIKDLLIKHGYAVSDEYHDCGGIGGLGAHRKRYLLIARNEKKLDSFVYKPPIKRLKTIGDVIGEMPLPGDIVNGGPMHRLQKLSWKTWVRLALIPAGGDWRDLNKLEWENYALQYVPRGSGAYGVQNWEKPANTVIGKARVNGSSAGSAVSDPRLFISGEGKANLYRVQRYDAPASCVTGAAAPSNGATCISDPRYKDRASRHPGVYQVVRYDKPAPCITGTRFGSGAIAISDPRVSDVPQRYPNKWQVQDWESSSPTITGSTDIQNGALSIGDPRLNCSPRSGTMGVMEWNEPAKTIIGAGDVHAGAVAVADPRDIPNDDERGTFIIIAEDGTWHRPLTTFELAILQGFPPKMPDGSALTLSGKSDARWRERIGNAVPPAAARAIAETMLRTLIAAQENIWLMSAEEIWVTPSDSVDELNKIIIH